MQHYGDTLNQRLTDEARHIARTAGKPAFAASTPAEQAAELIARMDVARQHRDRAGFETVKAELAALFERL